MRSVGRSAAWGLDIHSHVHVFENPFKCSVCRSFFQCLGLPPFLQHLNLAMSSCVDVVLSWALSGGEVQRWHQVPSKSLLDDLISEHLLESLPCDVKVVHNATVLSRPLRHELAKFTNGEEGVLVFGLVKVQVWYGLVPYLCLGGETAIRMRELEVSFTCPRGQPEKFSHAFAALPRSLVASPRSTSPGRWSS